MDLVKGLVGEVWAGASLHDAQRAGASYCPPPTPRKGVASSSLPRAFSAFMIYLYQKCMTFTVTQYKQCRIIFQNLCSQL